MLQEISKIIFSRHNSLPRTSIVFAVVFLAGFMALNIYSFHQNGKRIALIETINRENLPRELSDIQEIITHLDILLDNEGLRAEEKSEQFDKRLLMLKDKLTSLQQGQLAGVDSNDLTQNFVSIYTTLDGMKGIKAKNGLQSSASNRQLSALLHDAASHFYDIDKITQYFHRKKIDGILAELRDKERYLLAISVVFVVIGTTMIVFLLVDLFRRGELLERANQAERLKNSFFAMMSHEIRTPINGILGTITLLRNTKLEENQRNLTGIVQGSAESLLVIVNDVLDYSKIEAGKLELEYSDFNIKTLLDNLFGLIRPLADDKKLQLNYSIQDSIPLNLYSDPARLRQILLNFLSNAIKFTDKGGVTLLVKEDSKMVSGARMPMLRFEVIDTGMGISEESKSHLFREFSQVDGSYTRRFAGTGLGLAICRRLTDMMRGDVGVESAVGKGSTFWFAIPLTSATQAVIDQDAAQPLADKTIIAHVLLVEDNPTNQMIAEAFLKQIGHKVDVVDNGRKAVAAAAAKNYDVVFMDIAMPEMDGFAATKAIRALPGRKNMPIVAMTAHAMRGDREECLAIGMNDYITKPLSKEVLQQRVTLWAGKGSMADKQQSPSAPDNMDDEVSPEISEEHFNQIVEDLGTEMIGAFSKNFHADLMATSTAMLDAAKAQRWDEVKRHAHSMKSSTLSFGLGRLSQLAAQIETQCKENDKADDAALSAWPAQVKTAIAALNERFKSINIDPV